MNTEVLREDLDGYLYLRTHNGTTLNFATYDGSVTTLVELNPTPSLYQEVKVDRADAIDLAKTIVKQSTRTQLNEGYGPGRADSIARMVELDPHEVFRN